MQTKQIKCSSSSAEKCKTVKRAQISRDFGDKITLNFNAHDAVNSMNRMIYLLKTPEVHMHLRLSVIKTAKIGTWVERKVYEAVGDNGVRDGRRYRRIFNKEKSKKKKQSSLK